MFWGLSPALDLQEEYLDETTLVADEVNILIIGGCDARHILKTLAQCYRRRPIRINIHVIDGYPELIARQLMLLSIALANPNSLGLQEKTRFFMEIYGNTLLRATSSQYLITLSKNLIKMITDLDCMKKIMPFVFFDKVKYKERDYIEMLLKFWGTAGTNRFDICELWDGRLRKSLGVRYDCRLGVFDWDFNMRLRDIGGRTVNAQEFKHFRSTGVAFTWLETEVSRPNCSLAAGVIKAGEKFVHRGYLGDIVTGPYVSYGLDCEDSNMLKSNHGTYLKRCTDITERNLMRMFHELQNQEPFDPKLVDGDIEHNLGMVTLAEMDAKLSDQSDFRFANIQDRMVPCIEVDNAQVFFHSSSGLDHYPDKSEYQSKFHVAFIGYTFSKRITPNLMKLMAPGGLTIIEGCKFILDMSKENIKLFGEEIDKISKECGLVSINKFDPRNDSFAKFLVK